MWRLLVTTLAASAVDSLNPVAIAQQFVLQGMVKKPRHIWYFIIPTGIVNLAMGYLVFYGLAGPIRALLDGLSGGRFLLPVLGLALGAAFSGLSALMFLKGRARRKVRQDNPGEGEEDAVKRKIRSVSPAALVALGSAATIAELATAFPYFAFLAVLLGQSLTLMQFSVLLVIYNIVYMSPLMAMYFIYISARSSFDRFYLAIKRAVSKGSDILLPAAALTVGAALIFRSVAALVG